MQVGLPIHVDQIANAREAERVGFGIAIPFGDTTEENLRDAIRKVLDDPSYSKRAMEHGSLLLDQIEKPLDRAVWWLEYLLRHPNLIDRVRPPVHDLYWFQYFLLDVLAFILIVLLLVAYAVWKCVSCIFCRTRKANADVQGRKAGKAEKHKKTD